VKTAQDILSSFVFGKIVRQYCGLVLVLFPYMQVRKVKRYSGKEIKTTSTRRGTSTSILRCRKKFLKFFPKGFYDQKYIDWERGYKWEAHEEWNRALNQAQFRKLLQQKEYREIAARAVRIESRTNLLFSFEKMALRDGVKSLIGAKQFAVGLFEFLYSTRTLKSRFERWIEVVASLPRKQTRVLTWPILTVFGFIASPQEHIFLKPNVTKKAAEEYGFEFHYASKPSWEVYSNYLEFAAQINSELRDMKPQDMIDLQSFMWVLGSDEYEE